MNHSVEENCDIFDFKSYQSLRKSVLNCFAKKKIDAKLYFFMIFDSPAVSINFSLETFLKLQFYCLIFQNVEKP